VAIDELISSKKVDKICRAKMGILGVLQEELIDISAQEHYLLSEVRSPSIHQV